MKNFKRVGLASVAMMSVTAGSAFAALPTEVTDALETAKTDGVAMAGIVLAVIIAIAAFKFIRRAL